VITRRKIGALAVTTLVMFGLAQLTHAWHHGAAGAAGFLCWWGFLISLVTLVAMCIATVVRRRPGSQHG